MANLEDIINATVESGIIESQIDTDMGYWRKYQVERIEVDSNQKALV